MFDDPTRYQAMMGRWSQRLAPSFLDFCGAADTDPVLDVGCGTGALIAALRARRPVSDVCGVDPSAAFVAYSQQRFADEDIVVQVGSAYELPFADGTFGQVLSQLVLMVLDDPARAAREMARVARPGGLVAACTWEDGGLELSTVLREEATRLDPAAPAAIKSFRHCNRAGELAALWRASGLVNVTETVLEMRTDFANFDDYWLPLSGVGPGGVYVRDLDDARRAELRHAMRARLLQCGTDRPFSLHARALAVRGNLPD